MGVASSRLHHRVMTRTKRTQSARIVDFQKRQVLWRKCTKFRRRFPIPGDSTALTPIKLHTRSQTKIEIFGVVSAPAETIRSVTPLLGVEDSVLHALVAPGRRNKNGTKVQLLTATQSEWPSKAAFCESFYPSLWMTKACKTRL